MDNLEALQPKKEELSLQPKQDKLAQTTIKQDLAKLGDYEDYLAPFFKAKAIPSWVTSPEQAFMIIEYGKARGFSPIDSLHFITPVNGVMSTNAKGVGHLLKEAGYIFKEVYRAAFIYAGNGKEYISPRVLRPDEITYNLNITPEEWSAMSETKRANISAFRDRVTTIKYGFRKSDGKIEWEGEFSYYLSNAIDAGLMTKETYIKYTGDMFLHRAKTGLSKVLGLLTGSETEELAVVHNIKTDVIEGELTILN